MEVLQELVSQSYIRFLVNVLYSDICVSDVLQACLIPSTFYIEYFINSSTNLLQHCYIYSEHSYPVSIITKMRTINKTKPYNHFSQDL